jgi:virginiamycin B lyase
MWFTEQTGQRIGRITMAGTIVEFALPAGVNPIGIVAGPDGKMWFTESLGHRIGRIDARGKIDEISAGLDASRSPGEITVGPDGALWFTEDVAQPHGGYGSALGRIATSGEIASIALPDGSGTPNAIASDSSQIWFALGVPRDAIGSMDLRTHRVRMFDLPEGMSFPEALAMGPDGAIWFTLPSDHRIGRMTRAGRFTTYSMPNRGDDTGGPAQIALGPDGALWFTEFNQSRIGRITTTGAITEYANGITQGSSPDGLALGSDGSVWFTEYNGNAIGRLRL